MSATIMIPARLQSSRLPGKMLADIHGKPLIQHVYESVKKSKYADEIYIVTDAEEIAEAVQKFGANYFLTDPHLPSGTARIATVIEQIKAEYILNVQGDMPIIEASLIDDVILKLNEDKADIVTPVYPIKSIDELNDSSVAKVVLGEDGRALYFSRSIIPFVRDYPIEQWLDHSDFWGHIGIYAYKRQVLLDIKNGKIHVSQLEKTEKLEQLSFLSAGYLVQTIRSIYPEISVDLPKDLTLVRKLIKGNV